MRRLREALSPARLGLLRAVSGPAREPYALTATRTRRAAVEIASRFGAWGGAYGSLNGVVYVEDTIVAPVTPPGTGAVAIVRLSGPEAIRIMRAIWRPLRPRGTLRAHTLHLGEVRNPATGASIDRALGVVMPAPKSLTGEDVAELHCHGGAYLVRRVIALAMAHGARMAEPGEFSRRAFLNGRMDLTEAEAIADL